MLNVVTSMQGMMHTLILHVLIFKIAIIVQDIFPNGAARRDKRLRAGDVILKVRQ